jgi:hypothetical protein
MVDNEAVSVKSQLSVFPHGLRLNHASPHDSPTPRRVAKINSAYAEKEFSDPLTISAGPDGPGVLQGMRRSGKLGLFASLVE